LAESVGIDLVETERIRQILRKFGMRFVNRILGQKELLTYNKRGDKANFLAGRFAAKEAVIKSLGRFLDNRPAYNAIQIINDDSGYPLLSDLSVISKKIENKRCMISISHEKHYATAVSIISAGQ